MDDPSIPVIVVEDDEHAELAFLVLRHLEEVLHVPEELRPVLVDKCVALGHGFTDFNILDYLHPISSR